MPSAATIMSLSDPRAADDRSACTASVPSGSSRSSRCVSMATTSRRPSGNHPNPDGSSSSTRTTVSATPSSAVEMTRWSCMSLHHSRPSSPPWPLGEHEVVEQGAERSVRHLRTVPVLCNVGQMTEGTPTPVSAARVAELAGDALPDPAAIPDAAFDLVAATRDLMAAVVMTDVDAVVRAQAVADLADLTDTSARTRNGPTRCTSVATPTGGSRASTRPAPVGSTRRHHRSSGSTDRRSRRREHPRSRSRCTPAARSARSTAAHPGACTAACSAARSTRCSASRRSCRARRE